MIEESYKVPSTSSGPGHDNYIYVAGFPVVDAKPTWTEQKFLIDGKDRNISFTTSLHEMSTIPWLDRTDGIKLHAATTNQIIEQRSISQQITMNGLFMGSGSSGSMICAKIHGTVKVIAIWWGSYGKRFGAGDLLITNPYNPHKPNIISTGPRDDDGWINWSGYDLTSELI